MGTNTYIYIYIYRGTRTGRPDCKKCGGFPFLLRLWRTVPGGFDRILEGGRLGLQDGLLAAFVVVGALIPLLADDPGRVHLQVVVAIAHAAVGQIRGQVLALVADGLQARMVAP